MTEKFQNKYRIGSHRKPGWDYSSDGHYFITLVVQNRHEVLGRIENHEMNKKNERAAKNIHTFF
jgi:putative transposase